MSDASLVSFLQSELLLLSNEIKKKYPEIKESIENIFQLIRKIKDDPDRPNAVEVFSQTELILQPIVLSSRTGNSRVIAIALNCLQKLVIFKAFPRECIGSVFGVLETSTEMNSDIQLKSLQCLSPLMANYNDLYGSELVRVTAGCNKSKVGMVNNATAAIIRQMIISLFEWIDSTETSTDSTESSDNSHAQDALLILSDVVCRLDDRKCEVLDLSKVDKPFSLDLVESVLVNHGDVIRSYRPFSTLIQDRICPYLIDALKNPSNPAASDFPKICRHWRIIQLLITEFNDLFPDETEIFIAFGIRILREVNLNWECAMVLEVAKNIFQSQNLIEEIYLICEKKESPRIFKDLLEVMLEIMVKVLNSHPSDSQEQIVDALGKSSVLTQFDKSAPPAVSPIALLLLAYDAFNGWFGNLTAFLKATCTENNSLGFQVYKSSKNVNMNPKTVSIITDLILFIGTGLNQTMERIFVELCYNQPQLHANTIEFFSRSMIIYSVFEFRSQLRQLMDILLNFTASGSRNNLLIIQMILETSHGVGELLEDSLISVVRVIQITDHLQNSKTRQKLQQNVTMPNSIEDEILAKSIDLSVSLTESTVIWNEKSFTFFIQAYGQLIDELLQPNSDERSINHLILVLGKLKRLTSLNMSRFIESEKCSTSWELLMEEFCKPMKLKDANMRQISIEIVGFIVDLFIKSVPSSRMKASQSKLSDSACDNFQMRILGPLTRISHSVQWIDVQRILLDSLIKYINVFGESLTESSWSLIWSILKENLRIIKSEIGENTTESFDSLVSLYQKVHDVVKIASGDFISSIPVACFEELIDIIAEIGEISLPGELNIPLNTVRYLWDISDYLCTSIKGVSFDEVFKLWKGLLIHLTRLSLDSRPELRNSAVQTLLRTINMNGGSLKGHSDKWKCLFEEILFVFLKDLRQVAKSSKNQNIENNETAVIIPIGFAHFSRDSESKQWDETESTVMTGVTTLILTHFHEILIELSDFPRYWHQFLQILKDYVLLKDGSVELTSVAINCLYQFSEKSGKIDKRIEGYAKDLWETWISISENDSTATATVVGVPKSFSLNSMFFTQDSLLKYFKILYNLLDLCKTDLLWLEKSLKVLTTSLQCLTPSDQVRDIESATEVQKFLINQILMELINKQSEGEGKVLILREISCWLQLLTTTARKNAPLKDVEMISMGYASIRSRQSTASSCKSDATTSSNDGLIRYTFIAMTGMLLEKIPGLISSWKEDSCIYDSGCLVALIESLGKFMKLKYKCPMNNKMPPIWRTSTFVFVTILKEILQCDRSDLSSLWKVALNELKGSLHSAKEMFNRSLKIEEMEMDEKFDCQLIDLIVDFMIPRGLVDDELEIVDDLINLLFQVARITKFSQETSTCNEDFLYPSGVKSLPIAVKEIISFYAYKSIFKLADNKDGLVDEKVLEKLVVLLRKHLSAFQQDRRIFGNDFPFPRLRDLELHVLLKGLITVNAREKLRQVNDLIVKCADFGGDGCTGAKMIVKDCRKVLLLLTDKKKLSDSDSEDEFSSDSDSEGNENEGESIIETETETEIVETKKLTDINKDTILITTDSPKNSPITSPPVNPQTSSPKSTTTTSTPNSTRRSISEELFDHLAHDLRIMKMESAEDEGAAEEGGGEEEVIF